MTTQTLPAAWQRAIARAEADHLQALPLADGSYAVPSTKLHLGSFHIVQLDPAGHIVGCSDCPGFRGRHAPCKHAGAVARDILAAHQVEQPPRISTSTLRDALPMHPTYRLLREVDAELAAEKRRNDAGVVVSTTTRRQLYRVEAGA